MPLGGMARRTRARRRGGGSIQNVILYVGVDD
jgi:hypothetical protein